MERDEVDVVGGNDEEEIDESLALPEVLRNLPLKEKKQLLIFKNSHSEREWEEEILQRIEAIGRKLDYERLKRMMGSQSVDISKSSQKIKANNSTAAKIGLKRKNRSDSFEPTDDGEAFEEEEIQKETKSDEGNEFEVDDDVDEGELEKENEDDDDDLFDSDEEEEITKRVRQRMNDDDDDPFQEKSDNEQQKSKKRVLGKGKASRKSKSAKNASDDDSADSEMNEEEEEEEDEDLFQDKDGNDYNLQSIKDSHRKVNSDGQQNERNKTPKQKFFGSVTEYQKYLEDQNRQQELPQEDDDNKEADLQDFIKITLRRDYLISLLSEPFFEKYVKGCYVKYSIGVFEDKPVYRLCQIIGIENVDTSYKLPPNGLNSQITTTSKKLILHTGDSERKNQRIDRISNHTITQNELEYYLKAVGLCDENKLPNDPHAVQTKRDARVIRNEQKKMRNYVYNHDEIKSMVRNKVGFNKLLTTEYSTAMDSLLKKREEAQLLGDKDYLDAVNKNIKLLEHENDRQKTIFEKKFKKQLEVNRRMKESNVRRDMAAGMRKRQEDQEALAKGIVSSAISDPFIRRETRPKILWNTNEALLKQKTCEEDKKDNTAKSVEGLNSNLKLPKVIDIDRWIMTEELTLEEVQRRVKQRLGVDPFEEHKLSKRDRYLNVACKNLPSYGTEERERLRGHAKSLADYLSQMNTIKS